MPGRRRTTFLLALLLALAPLLPACQQTAAPPAALSSRPAPPTAAVIPLSSPKADEITFEQLAQLLPRRPIVVGFDVDDTLIFSAPAFNELQREYDPDVIRPEDYRKLTFQQRFEYREFWNRLNEEYDDRSIPKKIAKRLLDLHLARGDDIWLISKRQSSQPDTGTCTRRYERMFDVKLSHPVIFTQLKDKTPFLAERYIEYYYGDSDSDITAAAAAGAVPIRVKRGAGSYAKDQPHNGQLGEAVLKDSDR
jgi:acid phosphatase (class B)